MKQMKPENLTTSELIAATRTVRPAEAEALVRSVVDRLRFLCLSQWIGDEEAVLTSRVSELVVKGILAEIEGRKT